MNQQLVSALKKQFKSSLFSPQRDEQERIAAGFFSGRIPEDLLTQDLKDAGHTTLVLTGEEIERYYQTFEALRRARELEYLADNELKDQLWWLECAVTINQQEYKKDLSKLTAEIEGFVSRLVKPLVEHEVLIVIENFKTVNHEISLGDCTLRHFSRENLLEWGFSQHKIWEDSLQDFADKTVIVTREIGNNVHLVVERARSRADLRLHTLRVAFAGRDLTSDEQLRFRLSPHTAAREAGESRMCWCKHGFPGTGDLEYCGPDDKEYVDYATEALERSANLSEEFKERVDRSLYWLGRAIVEEELDQRVALLCTAMESLLSDKKELRKGERIAYRMVLLESLTGNAFVHPAKLLLIYNLRSSIVHGSSTGVASKTEYRTMLHAARCTLKNYVDFIGDKGFKKYRDLIKYIELSEDARKLSEWLGARSKYKAVREIKEALDAAIAGYEK